MTRAEPRPKSLPRMPGTGALDSSAEDTPPAPRRGPAAGAMSPLRKAAILVVSLEQPLASQLLAQLDRSAVEAVTLEIAQLERIDPHEQQAVLDEFYGLGLRRLRFIFEDLVRMDDTAIQEVYHDEDATTWALALAGASRPVRTKVLGALAPTSAAELRHALEHLGPFRLDDAEAAQAELAERLRRLHDHGRITLPDPSGQEEILA
jgi:flagellar motor switch protein FliG